MLEFADRVVVSTSERAEFLEFARIAARRAGEAILPFFRRPIEVDNKLGGAGFDPVTEGDRAAEATLRRLIGERYPAHGILGEEFGFKSGNGLTWVIDPIDGTRAFMSGMVHWGLLLGLFDGQSPIVGVMYQPFTCELWAGDGNRAWFQRGTDAPGVIRTRSTSSLEIATLGTTNPKLIPTEAGRDAYDRLEARVRLARYGGDCYIYAMVAMGFMDLGLDGGLQAYDVMGLIPIVQGAGGVFTNWAGESACMGGDVLASCNPLLHQRALDVLQPGIMY
jgi:myo-inositol-1(or 4)-monophosphatase